MIFTKLQIKTKNAKFVVKMLLWLPDILSQLLFHFLNHAS